MAVVVWVYAGGGDSEVGFIKCLIKHLGAHCEIKQQTPIRNRKSPRPNVPEKLVGGTFGKGETGVSLREQISKHIADYWDSTAGAILVFDDSDCTDPQDCQDDFVKAVNDALHAKGVTGDMPEIIVGLAIPEIEAWLLADWTNTLQHQFPRHHHTLGAELEKRKIRRESPEAYCDLPENEHSKFSDIVVSLVNTHCLKDQTPFSKGTDVPCLLEQMNPETVADKCPHFRLHLWTPLKKLCQV